MIIIVLLQKCLDVINMLSVISILSLKARTHGATLRATVCPPLRATVAEVESAPTSLTSRATDSPCVQHLQHCVQLRNAMLRAVMHHVSAP